MKKIEAYGVCIYKKIGKSYNILLCKSVLSNEKYGFLKGVSRYGESIKQTAIREFYEESNILVKSDDLNNLFYQKNDLKDIGIFLVNYNKIKNYKEHFQDTLLKSQYLCKENSVVKFFDIDNLPPIKDKQKKIATDIVKYLKSI